MVQRKLKIVQILPELEEGGVEGETLDLAVYLTQRGHESIVISGGGRLVSTLEAAGCRHLLWPHIGEKSYRCLKYINKLRKFFIDEKVDVVHLLSRLPAWLGYLAWQALPVGVRPALITTFHGFYSVNSYSTIMTRGERVVAVSEVIRDHILENYGTRKDKLTLIHGGFDEEMFNPAHVTAERVEKLIDSWNLKENEAPVILLPGRLTQWKGQDFFIDSLGQIKDCHFMALCVGDLGENPSFTKKLQDKIHYHQLQEKVKLVGHCNDMPAALSLADIVVSASSTQPEAFGKVAIEAMAMEKPIIATAHGGSLETVVDGKTGWLVEPLNVREMSLRIRKSLADLDACRRIGKAGRSWVLDHFTAEVMCRKSESLYYDLLEEKRRRKSGEEITVLQMLPDLEGGGVERGTLEMGKYLASNGHRSLVVSAGGRMVRQLEEEGSCHYSMNVGSKSPVCLKYLLPLRKLIKQERVDILHLRSRMPAWIGYLAWKSLPAKDRPVLVTTFHGFYSVNAYSAIMTRGEAIIAVSQSIKKHIAECYGKGDDVVSLIFRGVDGDVFNPDSVSRERVDSLRKDWNTAADRKIIMLPGRITRLKGQDVFLKSLKRLKASNYQAVLVGDINENLGYTQELRELVETENLGDRVIFAGHCSDMSAAYMLADIVVSASSSEPEAFGRTTVEAMSMGKAVVATAHGGSLETVLHGKTGWLVKPSDPDSMADALSEALAAADEVLIEYGKNGRARVAEKFTTRSMCEKTVELYRKYLQARQVAG